MYTIKKNWKSLSPLTDQGIITWCYFQGTMAEQQKRERKANWTVAEVNCLLENIAIHKSTLNSKCMQTVTTKLKNKIWAGITEVCKAN